MLYARKLTEEDYKTLCKWWADNRFPIPPQDALPVNGTSGVMVYDEQGNEICAGFIFDTSAKSLCWIEYIVANFEIKDKGLRKEAIRFLINVLIQAAKKMGKTNLFTSLKNESLINHFKACGFIAGQQNTVEMIYSTRT